MLNNSEQTRTDLEVTGREELEIAISKLETLSGALREGRELIRSLIKDQRGAPPLPDDLFDRLTATATVFHARRADINNYSFDLCNVLADNLIRSKSRHVAEEKPKRPAGISALADQMKRQGVTIEMLRELILKNRSRAEVGR